MKYMFLLYGSELPEPGTDEARTLLEQWSTARQAMADAGVLIDPPACSRRAHPPRCGSARRDAAHRRPAGGDQGPVRGLTLIERDGLDDAPSGGADSDRAGRSWRTARGGRGGFALSEDFGEPSGADWRPVVRATASWGTWRRVRTTVQDACALALTIWPAEGRRGIRRRG